MKKHLLSFITCAEKAVFWNFLSRSHRTVSTLSKMFSKLIIVSIFIHDLISRLGKNIQRWLHDGNLHMDKVW